MDKLLRKEVVLKSGQTGKITGFCQDRKDTPMLYLIEYWTDNGKSTDWLYLEDFAIRE